MQVLHYVEETLQVAEGVIGGELGILWSHLTLTGHNNAATVDEGLSRSSFACRLLALKGTGVVKSYKLLQEKVDSIHHILFWEFRTASANETRLLLSLTILILLEDTWEVILLLAVGALDFKFSYRTVLQALSCLSCQDWVLYWLTRIVNTQILVLLL